jgi:hypothetical protein
MEISRRTSADKLPPREPKSQEEIKTLVDDIIESLKIEYPELTAKLTPKHITKGASGGEHPIVRQMKISFEGLYNSRFHTDEEIKQQIKKQVLQITGIDAAAPVSEKVHFLFTGNKADDLYGIAQLILKQDGELAENVKGALLVFYPYYDALDKNPIYNGIKNHPDAADLLIDRMGPIIRAANQKK